MPWYDESASSTGATRDPEKLRQYYEYSGRCRAAMQGFGPASKMLTEPVRFITEKKLKELRCEATTRPTLLDIARRAVVEDRSARDASDLFLTLEMWWVPGAEALGLNVSLFHDERVGGTIQPPEMRAWLLNKEKTGAWSTHDIRSLPPDPCHCHPRELGEVMEFEGKKYVLIGFIQTEGWRSDFVDSAAFVSAEEIQL